MVLQAIKCFYQVVACDKWGLKSSLEVDSKSSHEVDSKRLNLMTMLGGMLLAEDMRCTSNSMMDG